MVLNNAYFGTLAQEYHLSRTIVCMPVPYELNYSLKIKIDNNTFYEK